MWLLATAASYLEVRPRKGGKGIIIDVRWEEEVAPGLDLWRGHLSDLAGLGILLTCKRKIGKLVIFTSVPWHMPT